MTEQTLVEYAKHGDPDAQKRLGEHYPGILWELAITHVNGRVLDMPDIKKTYDKMVEIHRTTAMSLTEVRDHLQKALNEHHAPKNEDGSPMTSAEMRFLKMKFSQAAATPPRRGTNRTPAKKKRK